MGNPTEQPVINICGEQVLLGPLRRDLVPYYHKWVNDFEVTRMLAIPRRPTTRETEEDWYEMQDKGIRSSQFTIYERSSMRPIGNTGLNDIDHFERTAIFGIVIGEKECWDKGYGTEATRLVLGYGFGVLGLHNIMLQVFSINERAIRAYSRAGFRVIGTRRGAHREGGNPIDLVFMDCISTEFAPGPHT